MPQVSWYLAAASLSSLSVPQPGRHSLPLCVWLFCFSCFLWFFKVKVVFLSLQATSTWSMPPTYLSWLGDNSLGNPPFRLATSVLWCWSWEKEGRAVEVVPGIYIGSFVFHVHSHQDQFIQPGWAECVFYLALVCILCVCIALICLRIPILLCFLTSWVESPLQVLALA